MRKMCEEGGALMMWLAVDFITQHDAGRWNGYNDDMVGCLSYSSTCYGERGRLQGVRIKYSKRQMNGYKECESNAVKHKGTVTESANRVQ